MAAWLRAQGDDEGAALADELSDRLNERHEGKPDEKNPTWSAGPDVEVDNEPDIRCSPAVGVIFENNQGELILTVDMGDGGDVAVVHMGDVVRWTERRGSPVSNRPSAVSGEIRDPRANQIPETPDGARERAAYEATVGDLDGAEFEILLGDAPETDAALAEFEAATTDGGGVDPRATDEPEPTTGIPHVLAASTRTEIRGSAGIGHVSITTDASGGITNVIIHDVGSKDDFDDPDDTHAAFNAARAASIPDEMSLCDEDGDDAQAERVGGSDPRYEGMTEADYLQDLTEDPE